jgi:peptidoglycan pentaglycine glycine transferase (the first glycine)
MPLVSALEWDNFLTHRPNAHLLQTAAWGDLKAAFGWRVYRLIVGEIGAQILVRPLVLGFSLAYLPKGPIGSEKQEDNAQISDQEWKLLLPDLDSLCQQIRAVFLKVEPDFLERSEGDGIPVPMGFVLSHHGIQPPRTLIVSLRESEEEVLGRMKQKVRYNIRLSLKKGVIVRPSSDLRLFHTLMEATGQRDEFGVHSRNYYQRAYELFYPRRKCELFVAEYEQKPLAALMVFAHGQRAWYFFGASSNEHRDRMPNYLLQWEAMRWARAQGCLSYDLWGVPDFDLDTLENSFLQRSEGLWGVYRFKRGFGGKLYRTGGPWDRIYLPAIYKLYLWWVTRKMS